MIVESASIGALGFDTTAKLTASECASLYQWGMKFAVRYLPLPNNSSANDLDAKESAIIAASGLALMAVQHVRYEGWTPSGSQGTSDGVQAATSAMAAGLPPGVTLWCDLEGVKGDAQSTEDHVNGWAQSVRHAGYDCGLYVGAGQPLNGDQLFKDLIVSRYWRSQSQVPNVSERGYCMLQLFPSTTVVGVNVDINVIQGDYMNGLPRWARQS